MAMPITHTVLSLKVFEKLFKDKELDKFIIGTNFPDIRYLSVIDREKTHIKDLPLAVIQKEESFLAGMHFHALLDEKRENYVIKQGYYDIAPKHDSQRVVYTAIKLYEDLVLSKRISEWGKYINFFDQVLQEEVATGVARDAVEKWHKIVQFHITNTCKEQPDYKPLLGDLGIDARTVEALVEYLHTLQQMPQVLDIINGLYDDFENILES